MKKRISTDGGGPAAVKKLADAQRKIDAVDAKIRAEKLAASRKAPQGESLKGWDGTIPTARRSASPDGWNTGR